MNVLLDTHTLLWLVSSPNEIDAAALSTLSDPATQVWVSAAPPLGDRHQDPDRPLDGEALLSAWSDLIIGMSAGELSIESGDAILAGRLPWPHRDPFDRTLVAQALRRNLTIATRDSKILDAALVSALKV